MALAGHVCVCDEGQRSTGVHRNRTIIRLEWNVDLSEWNLRRGHMGHGGAEKVVECLCPKALPWLGMEGTSGVF
jgi:hypothetical protein